MLRIYVCVLAVLFCVPMAQAEATKEELIAALKRVRAAVFAGQTDGAGTALAEGIEADRKEDTELAGKTSRVEFKFKGRSSIAKEFCPEDAQHPVIARLCRGPKSYLYLNIKGRPKGLMIAPLVRGTQSLMPDLASWSFADVAQIPCFADDVAFFAAMERDTSDYSVAVSRTETSITFVVKEVKIEGVMTIVFDLGADGMLTKYQWRRPMTLGGIKCRVEELLAMTWEKKGDLVVPLERTVRISVMEGNAVKQDTRAVIRFQTFEFAPQDKREFVVSALGVPEGANVVDQSSGRGSKYSPGTTDEEQQEP